MALWTAEQTERAQVLWRDGVSAAVIADRLGGGISRNAVIGRMHRTLGKKDNASAARARALSGKMKAKMGKKTKARHFVQRPATPTEVESSRREWAEFQAKSAAKPDAPAVKELRLLDLEPHHCRWPIGEPTEGFCGDRKVIGLPYCRDHALRAFDLDKMSKHTRALLINSELETATA